MAIVLTLNLNQKIFNVEALDISWTPQAQEYCLEQRLLCEVLKKDLNDKLTSVIDKKVWQIELTSLRADLMKNNWFKMVAISRLFPNKLSLALDIEAPIALLTNNLEIFAVSESGALLAPMKSTYLPVLPILKGENFFRNLELRKSAVSLLKDLAINSEFSPKTIAEMTYSKEENFNLLILPSKSIVKMSADHVAIKASRIAQVIEYLNSNQMNSRVIDARFSKKVLVRLRKGS